MISYRQAKIIHDKAFKKKFVGLKVLKDEKTLKKYSNIVEQLKLHYSKLDSKNDRTINDLCFVLLFNHPIISNDITKTIHYYIPPKRYHHHHKYIPISTKFTWINQITDKRNWYVISFHSYLDFAYISQFCDLKIQKDSNSNEESKIVDDKIEKLKKTDLVKIYIEESYPFEEDMTIEKLNIIFSFNLLELRILTWIENRDLFARILEFLKSHTKLRDLELYLKRRRDVYKCFDALSDNYVIKTVRLITKKPIQSYISKTASIFRSKRVAVDIALNTQGDRFHYLRTNIGETFYPD